MTRFRHLPAAGRAIIVAVAIGVLTIAVVACATSYNAIYRLVTDLGLYGYRTNQAFPLLVDLAFLVGESAAILGGIMRAVTRSDEVTRGWPYAAMLLCGAGTIAFNVWHAYLIGGRHDPLTVARCVVASLPPLLMIVSFQVLISIVKWVMLHLGRPLDSAAVLSPTGAMPGMLSGPVPGPMPGTVYGWPGDGWPAAYGELPTGWRPGEQMPTWAPSQDGQTSHPTVAGNGSGDQAEITKRHQVETYLARLDPAERGRLASLGPRAAAREVTAALTGQGTAVSERYVAQILDEQTARPRGSGARRRGRR
jgi:hypothetical protein